MHWKPWLVLLLGVLAFMLACLGSVTLVTLANHYLDWLATFRGTGS